MSKDRSQGTGNQGSWGGDLAKALSRACTGNPLEQVNVPDKAGFLAQLPKSFQHRDGEYIETARCGAISLSILPDIGKEIYFRTKSDNLYCITQCENGKWACFNANNGTGHFLNPEDVTSGKKIALNQTANLAGYGTGKITEIRYTSSTNTDVKSEFLSKFLKDKG